MSSSILIHILLLTTVSGFVNIHNIHIAPRSQNASRTAAVGGGSKNALVCRDENNVASILTSSLSMKSANNGDDGIIHEINLLQYSIQQTRRNWMQMSSSKLLPLLPIILQQLPAMALEEDSPTSSSPSSSSSTRIPTDATSGSLPDLPSEAVRSYLQYRFPLQLAADYYIFDLQSQVANVDEYGNIADLLNSQGGGRGGQGGSSRLERDFVNPMRIIGLSMPPDIADDLRSSQFLFEKAMSKLKKVTSGIRRDLPVEIDIATVVPQAKEAWEEGRMALNSYFEVLNSVTGLKGEMVMIPSSGPNQVKVYLSFMIMYCISIKCDDHPSHIIVVIIVLFMKDYGRSIRRYNEFMKKTKLCQNRGGPTLSAAWGQLMVSGYMQDSCGVEPLEGYFFQ